MTDKTQDLKNALGQNVPLSDMLGFNEYDIISELKPFEAELARLVANPDIVECKRIFKEAGVEWNSTWDSIGVA